MATTIHGQILTSTAVDAQGEQNSKEHLEELVRHMPRRMPLNQHHDHGQPTLGFLENFRVEANGDGWVLRADVTFDGPIPTWGGFSYSSTELVHKLQGASLAAFLPFPYYREDDLLESLTHHDGGTSTGRWVKKSAELAEIALIISGANFLLGPIWRRVYEEQVHPKLARLADAIKQALVQRGAKQVRVEFMQPVRCEHYDSTVELYFIPSEHATTDVVLGFAVAEAIESVTELLREDWTKTAKPVKRIVHVFDTTRCAYSPTSLIYADGSALTFDGGDRAS